MKRNTQGTSQESGSSTYKKAKVEEYYPEEEYDFVPDEIVEEVDEGDNTTSTKITRWRRPVSAEINSAEQDLDFQWLDIDMTSGSPLSSAPGPNGGEVIGSATGPVPIIRMYGVTKDGNSVFAVIHGFTPYFYASFPESVDLSPHNLTNMRNALDAKLRERARGEEKNLENFVIKVEKTQPMQSLMGYHFDQKRYFVKVYVAMPTLVPSCKRVIEDGIAIPGAGIISATGTFESNVPFVMRFMIDCDITGADWVTFPAGKYTCYGDESHPCHSSLRTSSKTSSRCTIEAHIQYHEIVNRPPSLSVQWSSLSPLRILSFDIECMGRKGHFPDAQYDPIIQISSIVATQGNEHNPIIKIVFTLNTCLPIVKAVVESSDNEADLLMKWRSFVLATDPDVITGYNIANFDFPYILNRAKALEKQYPKLKSFADLGRLKGIKAVMKDTVFQSSAFGKRENVETTINGRVIFDLLPYMYRNHKLSSYSLNSVSAEFLGQQKEDVHHSIISDLQMGTDSDRRRLAIYCLKDAYLPLLLLNKLSIMVNYVEMSRVSGVPLNFILTRGQQIKVFSMIIRKCRKENLLVPHVNRTGGQGSGGGDESYEGATVIEPKRAFYEIPIATLDFASLYPSIMQAYNLCYSTLISEHDAINKQLPSDAYEKSPAGFCFVKSTTKKGILPQILDELLAARKRAKKDMAATSDPMEKAVQNGRQLALKVSANSVYGFTGANVGQLPCLPIAASVTSYGRNLLFATRAFVEKKYTRANGYDFDAEVVYGDTDSVMVKFGYPTVEQAMPLAQIAADEVSAIFPRPIKLEFEKVYYPYLLMNKKRYAGLLWTNPNKYDKLDAKGLETVRRDNCLLVRKVVDTCLRKILIERNVPGAIEYTKSTISDLLQNKLDISMLVITKSLGKSASDSDYAVKQAHVELAMRMKKRDPGSAPNVGDRVPYVIIQAAKGAPAYDKSEDPVYVLEHGIPIDTEYYLTNQLSKPILRIFEPIIPNPQSLISGDHTRVICKPTPRNVGGGKPNSLIGFAVKKETCMNCKTLISDKNKVKGSPLCTNCISKEAEVYHGKVTELNNYQTIYNQLWTECQRCQGSFHQEVICSNRDCPIFYKRKKVQIDLQDIQESIDKFTSW